MTNPTLAPPSRYAVAVAAFVICFSMMALSPQTSVAVEQSCDTTVVIDETPFTLNADYVKSAGNSDPCLLVTVNNAVLNLNNHKIICRGSSGVCNGNAVRVNASSVVVKNGSIVTDGAVTWNFAINCTSFTFNYPCTVQDLFIEDATASAIRCAQRVETSVIVNSEKCIESYISLPNGGSSARYWQNFCDALGTGIDAIGPASGTPFIIERNFIRNSDVGGAGVLAQSGRFTVEHNVINADEPIDDSSATVTKTENICDDTTDCPSPTGEPFSFNLDF